MNVASLYHPARVLIFASALIVGVSSSTAAPGPIQETLLRIQNPERLLGEHTRPYR
jgi:hypothetical protein